LPKTKKPTCFLARFSGASEDCFYSLRYMNAGFIIIIVAVAANVAVVVIIIISHFKHK